LIAEQNPDGNILIQYRSIYSSAWTDVPVNGLFNITGPEYYIRIIVDKNDDDTSPIVQSITVSSISIEWLRADRIGLSFFSTFNIFATMILIAFFYVAINIKRKKD